MHLSPLAAADKASKTFLTYITSDNIWGTIIATSAINTLWINTSKLLSVNKVTHKHLVLKQIYIFTTIKSMFNKLSLVIQIGKVFHHQIIWLSRNYLFLTTKCLVVKKEYTFTIKIVVVKQYNCFDHQTIGCQKIICIWPSFIWWSSWKSLKSLIFCSLIFGNNFHNQTFGCEKIIYDSPPF